MAYLKSNFGFFENGFDVSSFILNEAEAVCALRTGGTRL